MATPSASATAVLTGAFLSGAMMSLSLMTVPVLLDTTTQAPQLFHQWGRMYHYGHQVLPTMAVGTFILYGYTAFKQRQAAKSWIIFALAGLVTVSMLPYTWIVMVPTNNELFRLEQETQEGISTSTIEDAQTLVIKWTWMHLTRSLMPLTGAVLGTIGTWRT